MTQKILKIAVIVSTLTSCSLYKSKDRKDFESSATSFQAQNLAQTQCSDSSVRSHALAAKLLTVENSPTSNESVLLWEYKLDQGSVFETDNLQGTYCIYENI